jgi:AMP-binding enzyme C-terminal domain
VVPRSDPEAGEVPVAHVALRGQATAEELLAYVAERVAPYKKLRAVRFTDQVPRSPAGKLLRRKLVEAERAGTRQRSRAPSPSMEAGSRTSGVSAVQPALLDDPRVALPGRPNLLALDVGARPGRLTATEAEQ